MSSILTGIKSYGICLSISLTFVLADVNSAHAYHMANNIDTDSAHSIRLAFPIMNAEKGKRTFVEKGCVSCHSVNGVGGHDAPAMDAHQKMEYVNPFDFAARMWNHAPGMIAAQEDAFDELVSLTGDDLANIIAFVHNDEVQHAFTENDLTAKARKMMNHGHGEAAPAKAHAEEVGHGHEEPKQGHGHAPGTPKHTD